MTLGWIIAMLGGYLAGSIPFGLLIGKAWGIDLRQHGSKNIGATNCGRVVGMKWGLLCFALDVLKGMTPVLVTGACFGWISGDLPSQKAIWMWMAAATMPMIGHIFPVWLKFRGGKGVATGLGILLGFWPYLTLPGFAAVLTWAIFASCLRYVSLASVMAAVLLPGYCLMACLVADWPLGRVWPLAAATGLMALLVVVRHSNNMVRLWLGTEGRLGSGKPDHRLPRRSPAALGEPGEAVRG